MNQAHGALMLRATGKAGSVVAAKRAALGRCARSASRSSAAAFDWDDRETWEPALSGADAVFFLPTETLNLADRGSFVAPDVQSDRGPRPKRRPGGRSNSAAIGLRAYMR